MDKNKKDMLLMAIKLVCMNIDRLMKKENHILNIWQRNRMDDQTKNIMSVHIDSVQAFMDLFEDRPYKFTEDGDYIYLIEDGVQFYTMVD